MDKLDKALGKMNKSDSKNNEKVDEDILTDNNLAQLHNYNSFEKDYPSVYRNSQFPDFPPPDYTESTSDSTPAYNYGSYYSPPLEFNKSVVSIPKKKTLSVFSKDNLFAGGLSSIFSLTFKSQEQVKEAKLKQLGGEETTFERIDRSFGPIAARGEEDSKRTPRPRERRSRTQGTDMHYRPRYVKATASCWKSVK